MMNTLMTDREKRERKKERKKERKIERKKEKSDNLAAAYHEEDGGDVDEISWHSVLPRQLLIT